MKRNRIGTAACGLMLLACALVSQPNTALRADPIAIADIKHDGPVDFQKEVLPILRRNCLACHNSTDAESDLVLETPESILKGGAAGPSAVPGKSEHSWLLIYAAHQEEPVMPPPDNSVKAKALTPEELGLIKLWIDQGAKGSVATSEEVVFEKLPPGVNPIYAVAMSPDGQYVAAGRANQVFLYHVPSKREIGRLTDPGLIESGLYENPGVAHVDLIQSLAFSPDSRTLASGGYRTVKLWSRARNHRLAELQGLEGPAQSMAVSTDGKWVAFGEQNGSIKLFDLGGNKLQRTIKGHNGPVSGVSFSRDGSKLVSGSQDKTIRLWNTADGKQIGESLETPAPVNAVAFVSGDKQVATGNADNVIRIWDLPGTEKPSEPKEGDDEKAAEPPKPVREIRGHGGPVTSLAAIGADGAQLLSGSTDSTVRHWNVADGNTLRQLNHGGPVVSVAVRPDGQRFASASSNNTAKLWNGNGQQIAELRGDLRAQLAVEDVTREVALANKRIANAKNDLGEANKRKAAEETNLKNSEEAKKKAEEEFKKKEEAAKKPLADKEAADKEYEAAQAEFAKAEEAKKQAEAEATAANEALQKAQQQLNEANKAASDAANAAREAAEKLRQAQEAAKADPDNNQLADAVKAAEKAAQEAEQKSKDAAEAKAKAEQALKQATDRKNNADSARNQANQDFNNANNKMNQAKNRVNQLAGPAQKALDEKNAAERAFQTAERSVERAKQVLQKATETVPEAEVALKAEEEALKQKTADLDDAKKSLAEREKPLAGVAFSPDGSTLATASENGIVYTWDTDSGAPIDSFAGQDSPQTAIGFTSDGNLVSAAENKSIVVWETKPQWKLQRTIGSIESPMQLVDRVTSLAFSPDGKLLATGGGQPSRSGELKIWNVEDGSMVREIEEPHSDTIFGLEFSPGGKYIASCGADRFAKVFQVSDGAFVKSFEGHTHHVLGVTWSADGRTLATSGADNVVKVWNFLSGDQQRTISGFNKEVTAIRFVTTVSGTNANIVNVVASCGDRNVYMKRTDNGGNVRNFGGNADYVYSVSVSADGQRIAAGGQDSIVRVWQDNGQLVASFAPPPQPEQTASTEP